MSPKDRAKALRDLEKLVRRLGRKHWSLQTLETCDDRAEGFQAVIRLSHHGYDVERKGVM